MTGAFKQLMLSIRRCGPLHRSLCAHFSPEVDPRSTVCESCPHVLPAASTVFGDLKLSVVSGFFTRSFFAYVQLRPAAKAAGAQCFRGYRHLTSHTGWGSARRERWLWTGGGPELNLQPCAMSHTPSQDHPERIRRTPRGSARASSSGTCKTPNNSNYLNFQRSS